MGARFLMLTKGWNLKPQPPHECLEMLRVPSKNLLVSRVYVMVTDESLFKTIS